MKASFNKEGLMEYPAQIRGLLFGNWRWEDQNGEMSKVPYFSIDASSGTVTLVKESTETVENETVTTYVPAETSDYPDTSANGNMITIKNTPGAALPSTGGPGTHLIYLLGIIFTSLAGTGLIMKRRRKNAA